jgi:HD-GYP domain-containing protein (c-di-GMP phosphodiesterase class II)
MRQCLDVSKLRIGMYVAELDRPWRETPFTFQGFEITRQEEIDALKRYCHRVYVCPKEHIDVRSAAGTPASARPLPLLDDDRPTRPRLNWAGESLRGVAEEAEAAQATYTQAKSFIAEALEDARLGRSLNAPEAKRLVAQMTQSVLRNSAALLCLTQLRQMDEYAALHCVRVCILGLAFGHHLGFDEGILNLLGLGCLLHDLGKMKVPTAILNKPARLTPQEFEIVKRHVPWGVEILERTRGIPGAAVEVARLHHERYNGKGYINHLNGDQIGQFGMIGAIVDTYDAITSDRVYRQGISTPEALAEMYGGQERDFDPTLIVRFIECIGVYPIGSIVRLNTGEVGVVIRVNHAVRLKPKVALVLKPDLVAYRTLKTVDLAQHLTPQGWPYVIEKVLATGAHGISLVDILPMAHRI